MSTLSEIKEIESEINKLLKEAKVKVVKEIFKKAVPELFVEYPNLKRISWTQYTPYFNDGDTCEFGSSHTSPAIYFTTPSPDVEGDKDDFDGYEEEWSDYSYYDYDKNYKNYKNKKLKPGLSDETIAQIKTAEAVIAFLGNFDNDDMLDLFGDHQKVILTAKGIEVEGYNHD